jgi:cytochrome b subunit of formate dehydrogenase
MKVPFTVIHNGTVYMAESQAEMETVRLPPEQVRYKGMSLSILSILAIIALVLAVGSLIWSQFPLLQVSVILLCVALLIGAFK